MKDAAHQEFVTWMKMHRIMAGLLKNVSMADAQSWFIDPGLECIEMMFFNKYGLQDAYLGSLKGFKDQVGRLMANMAANYSAIWQDPADPDFTILPVPHVSAGDADTTSGASPVARAYDDLGDGLLREAARAEAMLHALERYQGALEAGDAEWALKQARAVRDLSTALDEHLATDQSLADLRGALAGKAAVLDAKLADGRAVINRIRTSGFSPTEQQVLTNRGLSKADIRRAEDAFVARGQAHPLTTADLLGQIDAVLAAEHGMQDALAESAQGWDDLVTDLEDRAEQGSPEADAGGPYTTTGGAVTLDGRGSTPSRHGAFVRVYDWDLDGDGAYDDAQGPTPDVHVATSRTIGLKVTDDNGFLGVDTARVVVTGGDRAPVVTAVDPASRKPTVTVGEPATTFAVTASDPDGDVLTYRWTLDGEAVAGGNGASLAYDPSTADVGARVLAVTVAGARKATSRSWVVSVLRADADLDGWTIPADCDVTQSRYMVNEGCTGEPMADTMSQLDAFLGREKCVVQCNDGRWMKSDWLVFLVHQPCHCRPYCCPGRPGETLLRAREDAR